MCRTGAAPPTHEHECVTPRHYPGTGAASAGPRERWGVLRGPPMAMRTGVGLGTDGSRAASKSRVRATRPESGVPRQRLKAAVG